MMRIHYALLCFVVVPVWGQSAMPCLELPEPVALFLPDSLAPDVIPTNRVETTLGLLLDTAVVHGLRQLDPHRFKLALTLPGGEHHILQLEQFSPVTPDFRIGRTGKDGYKEEEYKPNLRTYRVRGAFEGGGTEASGTVVFMAEGVWATFRIDGEMFDCAPVKDGKKGQHALFALSDYKESRAFSCGVETDEPANHLHKKIHPWTEARSEARSSVTSCLELALDIDYYTYQQFGNACYDAVEWSLALAAGVNSVYLNELDDLVTLGVTYVHVWETPDPFAGITGNAGSMLNAFRLEWISNPDLNGIERDLVHLLTRRPDTGTGGIAYLDVLCSSSYGAGFSANLTSTSTYNITSYSWNLFVVAHELGHNFGSNHTHWCGWPGGPIDHCYYYEGTCGGDDTPVPSVGTIMSYCHAIAGGSIDLAFHPTCEIYALIPGVNGADCLNGCAQFDTNCQVYGCTDPTYCNYDPEAEVDNGTCADWDICGVCQGDGSSCVGCTAPNACNYDPGNTIDDGSCFFAPGGGPCSCVAFVPLTATLSGGESTSVSLSGVGFLAAATVLLQFSNPSGSAMRPRDLALLLETPDGVCLRVGGFDVQTGCANAGNWPSSWSSTLSGNYAASATLNAQPSGSGVWTISILNGWSFSPEVTVTAQVWLYNLCIALSPSGCTDPTACNYFPPATSDDGSCDYLTCLGCTEAIACNYAPTATIDDGSCDYTSCIGCTDPSACNFVVNATQDDSSCEFTSCAGCTDVLACNYDPGATIEDGSCEFSSCINCPGDLNLDQAVTVHDVLIFLEDFGCTVPTCSGDANEDGTTNVSDLLVLLTHFGIACGPG